MTNAKWVRDLLDKKWEKSYPGRADDVPKPEVIVEGDTSRRGVQYDTQDVIYTMDGGLPLIEPQSLGYNEERVEAIIDIEMMTSVDRFRLLGTTDDTYGGLSGEVKRIIDEYRLGVPDGDNIRDPGYDILVYDTFDDEIGDRPAEEWGGTWTIRFINFATSISQSPANQ